MPHKELPPPQKQRTLLLAVLVALCWTPVTAAQPQPLPVDPVRGEIRSLLDYAQGDTVAVGSEFLHAPYILDRFYEKRGYLPAWTPPLEKQLLGTLGLAGLEGLIPGEYHLGPLARNSPTLTVHLPYAGTPLPRAERDVLLTDAFLLYASHLLAGRVVPDTLDSKWLADRNEDNLTAALNKALKTGDVRRILKNLRPADDRYLGLKSHLARLRSIAASGGWPGVPPGPTLRPENRDPRIQDLKHRLSYEDGVSWTPPDTSLLFDAELEAVVRQFQDCNGLEVDGLVGRKTLATLNETAQDRVNTILVNLERWRWFPRDLGDRYIRVNVPAFSLEVVDSGRSVLEMKVVVGRTSRRTPMFTDRIDYLVLAPFWNVPIHLTLADKVPQILEDPKYLSRQGIRVMSGWGSRAQEIPAWVIDWEHLTEDNFLYYLRQDPGPKNALGRVKFMFPNKYKVYLHDTPARGHFQEADRDYSSGCVRLEHAMELAELLLKGKPGWDLNKIETVLEGGVQKHVTIPRPIPVHLLYLTAWCDESGRLQMRKDIYGRDAEVLEAMATPLPAVAPKQTQ